MALIFARLANAVELQGQRALLVRGVILVQNTLSSSLIDRLHCDLVSALGLGAIAFSGSRLELLECADKKSTVQNGILAKNARNCKHFFEIF